MSGIIKPLFGTPISLTHPLGPAGGLVCCLPFNENSGNKVYDASGYGNHGTLINMSAPPTLTSGWGPGPHGGALAFDGSNDYVAVIGKLVLTKATVVIKLYMLNLVVNAGFIYSRGTDSSGIGTRSGGGNLLSYTWNSLNYAWNSSLIIALNKWYLAVLTVEPTKAVVYLLSESGFLTSTHIADHGSSTLDAIRIGSDSANLDRCFPGFISHVSIYNRALSAEEIAYLYAFPYCMFGEPGLPAWMMPNNIPALANYYRQMRAA